VTVNRPYDEAGSSLAHVAGERTARMQAVADVLWRLLHPMGVSWVGFYLYQGGEQLVLGPRRDRPACSPIGLHGVCGQAFSSGKPTVVHDVRELGGNYIACDPRDRSEVVVPLLDDSGRCWGVLDVDSHELGAFSQFDVDGLQQVLLAAGLTKPVLPTAG